MLTYDQLVGLPRMEQVTDLHCVEGWGFYDIKWEGMHLSTLLERGRGSAPRRPTSPSSPTRTSTPTA